MSAWLLPYICVCVCAEEPLVSACALTHTHTSSRLVAPLCAPAIRALAIHGLLLFYYTPIFSFFAFRFSFSATFLFALYCAHSFAFIGQSATKALPKRCLLTSFLLKLQFSSCCLFTISSFHKMHDYLPSFFLLFAFVFAIFDIFCCCCLLLICWKNRAFGQVHFLWSLYLQNISHK